MIHLKIAQNDTKSSILMKYLSLLAKRISDFVRKKITAGQVEVSEEKEKKECVLNNSGVAYFVQQKKKQNSLKFIVIILVPYTLILISPTRNIGIFRRSL